MTMRYTNSRTLLLLCQEGQLDTFAAVLWKKSHMLLVYRSEPVSAVLFVSCRQASFLEQSQVSCTDHVRAHVVIFGKRLFSLFSIYCFFSTTALCCVC